MTELGLPVNKDKLVYPAKIITCLGITIDIALKTLSIERDKICEIQDHCKGIVQKKFLSRRSFQSLLGKLFYIHKCVKPSRIFMNRMLHLFRKIAIKGELN